MRRSGSSSLQWQQPISEDDKKKFEEGWTEMMKEYWRERMYRLRVIDTGALYGSIKGSLVTQQDITTIEHTFNEYGVFVARGTSPAFDWKYWGHNANIRRKDGTTGRVRRQRNGNGQLEFLDPQYREDNGLMEKKRVGRAWGGRLAGGNPKGKRDWLFGKYYASVDKLNEFEAMFYGSSYCGMVASLIQEVMTNGASIDGKNRIAVKWD